MPSEPDLETLLLDYEVARTENTSDLNLVAAIVGAAVTLLIGLGAVLAEGKSRVGDARSLFTLFVACGLPLAPGALLAYGLIIATRQTLRSYYIREIEWSIKVVRDSLARSSGAELLPDTAARSHTPSWGHIEVQTAGHRGGVAIKVVWLTIYFTINVAVLALVALAARTVTPSRRWIVVCFNLILMCAPATLGIRAAVGGSRLWADAQRRSRALMKVTEARTRAGISLPPPAIKQRAFAAYLIVPRVSDHLGKVAVVGLAGALASFRLRGLDGFSRHSFIVFGSIILIFEYLLYQGRYMINDLRGVASDGVHAYAAARGRIPGAMNRRHLLAVLVVAALRIAAAFVLSWRLYESTVRVAMLIACSAVLLAAVPYEFVRSRCDSRGDTLKERFDIALPVSGLNRLARSTVLLVGPGYGIRAALGVAVGGRGAVPAGVLLVFGAAMAAAESSNVAMGWVLEATSFFRSRSELSRRILQKPHVLELAQRAGIVHHNVVLVAADPPRRSDIVDATRQEPKGTSGPKEASLGGHPELGQPCVHPAQEAVLAGARGAGPRIWNAYAALAGFGAIVAGRAMADGLHSVQVRRSDLIAGVLVAAVLVPSLRAGRASRVLEIVPIAGLVGAAMVTAGARGSVGAAGWALAPLALVGALYVGTRMANYVGFVTWVNELASKTASFGKALAAGLLALVVSKATMKKMLCREGLHGGAEGSIP